MGTIKALTGNGAVAEGVALCRPDVIAAYPITPQSSVVEKLSLMAANGEIDANLVEVESEHSSMSVVQGAALVGGRVFTATAANGLHLMYEPYLRQPTLRLPMLMPIATREVMSPHTIFSSHQDAMMVRDGGWIMMFCETNQEVLDMMIQGYKIAENKEVLLPINVCYDGFFLSHLTSRVEVPNQEDVDEFLGEYSLDHIVFDPDNPMSFDPMTSGSLLMQFRESHMEGMQAVLSVAEEVDKLFEEKFGRSYGGLIDTYRCEDADAVIISLGSHCGTIREVIDEQREKGKKVGLIRLRFIRPFPVEKLREAMKDKKAYCVIDRDAGFGWNSGLIYQEVRAAIGQLEEDIPNFSAIGGLGGQDINKDHVATCIEKLYELKDTSKGQSETIWLA